MCILYRPILLFNTFCAIALNFVSNFPLFLNSTISNGKRTHLFGKYSLAIIYTVYNHFLTELTATSRDMSIIRFGSPLYIFLLLLYTIIYTQRGMKLRNRIWVLLLEEQAAIGKCCIIFRLWNHQQLSNYKVNTESWNHSVASYSCCGSTQAHHTLDHHNI
jgi:hypothetical protein